MNFIFFILLKMATRKGTLVGDVYEYEYDYKKKDGTKGTVKIKVPKKKVVKREKVNQYKEGDTYVYVYKTQYDDGNIKLVTMKKRYTPKKDKNVQKLNTN